MHACDRQTERITTPKTALAHARMVKMYVGAGWPSVTSWHLLKGLIIDREDDADKPLLHQHFFHSFYHAMMRYDWPSAVAARQRRYWSTMVVAVSTISLTTDRWPTRQTRSERRRRQCRARSNSTAQTDDSTENIATPVAVTFQLTETRIRTENRPSQLTSIANVVDDSAVLGVIQQLKLMTPLRT